MAPLRASMDVAARRLAQPEAILVVLAFAFHTTWEFLQDPLYAGLAARPHADVRIACLQAAAGDVVMTLASFYVAATTSRSRFWFIHPTNVAVAAWFLTGLLLTVSLEWRAAGNGEWMYAPSMPIVPILRVGLAPLAQWIVIPALLLFLIQRHVVDVGRVERKTP